MFNTMYQMVLLVVLFGGFPVPGISKITVDVVGDLEAFTGMNVRLGCYFTSTNPVSLQSVSVTWFFAPLHEGGEETVIHYHERPQLPTTGRFKDRVVWSGDIEKKDATITLQQVSPDFNGTYGCHVVNPPDVRGKRGRLTLTVSDIGLSASGWTIQRWMK